MATTTQLRADITKLKKAIASKFTPKSAKSKLEAQLKKVEKELADKKAGKSTTSTTASTKATFKSLKDLVRRTKELSIYKGTSEGNLKNDADKSALPSSAVKGRRISKGLRSNQYGDKGSNKGHVYYEYRKNRIDVKQPRSKQRYPILEDGGMMADGGELSSSLKNRLENAKKRYGVNITKSQSLKAYEMHDIKGMGGSSVGYELFDAKSKRDSQTLGDLAIDMGRYYSKMADGGMMAEGGRLSVDKKYDSVTQYMKHAKKGDLVLIGKDESVLEWASDSYLDRFVEVKDGEAIFKQFGKKGLISPPSHYSVIVVNKKYEDGGMMAKGGGVYGTGHAEIIGTHRDGTKEVIAKFKRSGDAYICANKLNESSQKYPTTFGITFSVKTDTKGKFEDGGMAEKGMEMPNGGNIQSNTHKLHG